MIPDSEIAWPPPRNSMPVASVRSRLRLLLAATAAPALLLIGLSFWSADPRSGARPLAWVAALAACLGLVLAVGIARQIATGLHRLAVAGTMAAPSRLRELHLVAERLARTTAERDRATAALRSLVGGLRAEVAARTSELAAAETATCGEPFRLVGLMRPDGTLLDVNRQALAFAGMQAGDVLNRPICKAGWWGGDLDRIARLRSAVARAAGGELVRLELDISQQGAAGRQTRIMLVLRPVHETETGSAVRLLVAEAHERAIPAAEPGDGDPGRTGSAAAAALDRLSQMLEAASDEPTNPQPPIIAPVRSGHSEDAIAASNAGGARLLLVDDSAMLRGLLAAELEQHGYRVVQAGDAAAALAVLRSEPVDLLVSDLAMPGPSGLELICDARALHPSLPAVLLTGHASHAATLVANEAGYARFIVMRKPLAGRQLASHFATLLDHVAGGHAAATPA